MFAYLGRQIRGGHTHVMAMDELHRETRKHKPTTRSKTLLAIFVFIFKYLLHPASSVLRVITTQQPQD